MMMMMMMMMMILLDFASMVPSHLTPDHVVVDRVVMLFHSAEVLTTIRSLQYVSD